MDARLYFGFVQSPQNLSTKLAVNRFIYQGKYVNGWWNLAERIWLHANDSRQAARVSIKFPDSTQITEVNSPTWDNLGYTGNGTNMYLNSNFTQSVNAVNSSQNSECIGVYVRNNVGASAIAMGVQDTLLGNNSASYIIPRFTDDKAYAKMNNDFTLSTNVSNTDSRGLTVSLRDGATHF